LCEPHMAGDAPNISTLSCCSHCSQDESLYPFTENHINEESRIAISQVTLRNSDMRCGCVLYQLHEVEAECENEARKSRDLAADNRKLARQLVEQKNQNEADRRQVSELTEQCSALGHRVKTLKRQLDEAVSIGLLT